MSDASFYDRVYDLVRLIPFGRVATYGDIAKYLGSGKSARLVGWAMNNSHLSTPPVPAHRVVNRLGILSGKHHFGAPNLMQQLLENEGIVIVDDQIQNFEQLRWDPAKEL